MKKALTIAGYDPSNGAGITKDLEIFSSLGVHGISVPTCMVLQGPQGVSHVYPVPYPQFYEMIDMVKRQSPVNGIKIGAVWNEAYVDKIALFLRGARHIPLVIDPVMAAKNGQRLVSDEGLQRMKEALFPVADVVTPNTHEASAITGRKVSTLKDMKACAKEIFDMGPQAVIIKGGHLKGEPVDVFFDGRKITLYEKQRIGREVHGTGCMFSSLVTAFLVHGRDRREAFFASEELMEALLRNSYRVDMDGYFYASSGAANSRFSGRWRELQAMKGAGGQPDIAYGPGVPGRESAAGFLQKTP